MNSPLQLQVDLGVSASSVLRAVVSPSAGMLRQVLQPSETPQIDGTLSHRRRNARASAQPVALRKQHRSSL